MFPKLRKKLNDRGMSLNAYAKFLSISRRTLGNKLNGKTEFTLAEIEKTAGLLETKDWSSLFQRY